MITIVSHDAGGAEVISSWVRQSNFTCNFVLDGPAINIFKRKLGDISIGFLDDIMNSDSILCGSSWGSDLELNAISYAKSINKKTVVFLDHWVNYKERFTRKGVTILPEKILVGDIYAEQIARKTFPYLEVNLVENPYLKDIYNDYKHLKETYIRPADDFTILYVCEPVREHAFKQYGEELYWGYTEEDALNYFLLNINFFEKGIKNIVIRLHPAEKIGKYDWVINKFNLPIVFEQNSSLIESVAKADVVVGCQSMAMVVALIAEKKVISSIPKGGRKCVLPHAEILHLQNLLTNT